MSFTLTVENCALGLRRGSHVLKSEPSSTILAYSKSEDFKLIVEELRSFLLEILKPLQRQSS